MDLTARAGYARNQFRQASSRGDSRALRQWSRVHGLLLGHRRGPRSCCRPDGPCWELARALRLTDQVAGASA